MKNPFTHFISLLFMGFGFVSILWVASSLSGRAHSQTSPPSAEVAPAAAPSPAVNAPAPSPSPAAEAEDEEDDSADPNTSPTSGATEAQTLLPGLNPDGYTYDPTGRRDPFTPYGTSSVLAQPLPMVPSVPGTLLPPSAPDSSLSLFDLNQLRVVAIIWDVKDPKAMIVDPKGKLHMFHKDSPIGRNNGFVYAIREGEVVVVEPVQGEGGVQSVSTRVMVLNEK